MMVPSDHPALTRRQARAAERAGIPSDNHTTRRATTAGPTSAGDAPSITTARVNDVTPEPLAPQHHDDPPAQHSTKASKQNAPSKQASRTLTRRELRAQRQTHTKEHAPTDTAGKPNDDPETIVDKESGRVIEIDPKVADVVHPSPPEWVPAPVQKNQTGDADHSFDELIIGSGTNRAVTTNALILPVVPERGNTTPLNGGEILITGSIDLPHGLGSTGQHPNVFDGADIDQAADREERNNPRSGAIPVRASSAVSTQSSTRGVIMTPHGRDNRLPLILMIIAAALALGVAAVLVAGFVLGAF